MSNQPRRSFDMGAEVSIVALVIGVVAALVIINIFIPDRAEPLTGNILFVAVPALGSLYAALKAQEASRQSKANSAAIDTVSAKSDANAATTQTKVDDLTATVKDGFPKVVSETTAAMVDVNARRTAEVLAKTLAETDVQKKAEADAQKQRDDLAAVHAKMDLLLAHLGTVPALTNGPVSQPAAADIQANTAQLGEATVATAENTQATLEDTKTRLTNLETAAELPPRDGEPKP